MTKDGAVTMSLLDQRLDALDRALLGLVSRSERISMVSEIEQRFRDKQKSDPAVMEILEPLPELAANSGAPASREVSRSQRRRSRLALSAGVMGIVAASLLLLLPITYVVVASMGEVIGEVPAIAMIVLNVGAVAGLGVLGAVLSLAAIVRLSRSMKQTRGLGWAITGLCTSPVPAILGLLAMVFFVLPITLDYTSRTNRTAQAGDFEVPTTPASVPMTPQCGPNGCTIPPALGTTPYATESLPALSPPIPTSPNQAYAPANEARVARLTPVPEATPATNSVAKPESDKPKEATAPLSSGSDAKPDASAAPMYLPPLESADSLP